jgi:hypothetical protein
VQDKEQIKFSSVLFTSVSVFGVNTRRILRIQGGIFSFIFEGTIIILFDNQEINQKEKSINELSDLPFPQTLNNGLMGSSRI